MSALQNHKESLSESNNHPVDENPALVTGSASRVVLLLSGIQEETSVKIEVRRIAEWRRLRWFMGS